MEVLKEAISNLSEFISKIVDETFDYNDFKDLTQQQLNYLKVVVKLKNPTLSELARELRLTKPTVTVLADKLTEKGYVERVPSDLDRRVMHLHVSDKGNKINKLHEIAHERLTEKIKSRLSEAEILILTELLMKAAQVS